MASLDGPCPALGPKQTCAVHDGGAKKRIEMQTDRQKILAALAEKPLTTFNIMKRVNIKSQDECQTLLLKMRDEGAVKFDIHKGVWNIVD